MPKQSSREIPKVVLLAGGNPQIAQVLAQIDAPLAIIKSDRTRLLQVLIYVAQESDGAILNELWDAWVPAGHAPVRAMVQAGLGAGCRVEMVVTAVARTTRETSRQRPSRR